MRLTPKYRWLPTPFRSLLLFMVWLLLNQSIEAVHLFFGVILALLIPLLTLRFREPQPLIERPLLALRYILLVIADIVTANIQVSMLILGPKRRLNPAFVRVPLDLQHNLPITILASTVSMTPGTVSAEVYPSAELFVEGEPMPQRYLLIHVLNLTDETELIESIKQRYEMPLKEIFQC
ncbi:Na+/H+ antiporter subunit E [Rheinheimera baltica]|uniref:Na+/H+ antiporter subunit E n=1 Tax=Rheinheimera baltica TaxID=67576 RepID=A0ABT9I0C8_9GAMM|nr:Na+/H+ antiporter subunit E [Rheinheimera baltica]MDP5136638.1 Na+/H+ antiporter subunit E [Rheinheimera baltica]MDP5142472.1 Na+/H+ antiporter subunit E [Rheinheimera baltica]MDP5150345.1 Na+/H+ antiporter subunit E [Rheinheimera baltica]MDP5188678.1 Na+/H+ antiporter subunit E [Rheinheimera baltica]